MLVVVGVFFLGGGGEGKGVGGVSSYVDYGSFK